MKRRQHIFFCLLAIILFSCADDNGGNLPSVEDRIDEAVEELTETLVAPQDGWRLDYRPANGVGTFFILLDFNEDGTVRVQSDILANDGEFRDHVMSYRIDSSQGIELIFETYGVFHFLFELQQASFGGEFEFIYKGEEGSNLVFSSKTDVASDVTDITLIPATTVDSQLISETALSTLGDGIFQSEDLGRIGSFGNFNFHIPDQDLLLSAVFDLEQRKVKLLGIGQGSDEESIVGGSIVAIDEESTFGLRRESLVLTDPVTVSIGGAVFEIDEIPITASSKLVESFCEGQQDSVTRFSSSASDFGAFEATSSLFQAANNFEVSKDDVYFVNQAFLYDENDNSIIDQIESVFPDVVGFQWYHGVEISDSLFYGVGFVTVDEFNNADFFLRGFDFTQNGNLIEMTFNGKDLISPDDPSQEQLDGLYEITDLLFSGGDVYMLELLNIEGLFEFYNPCNKHKGFLIK